MEKRKNKPVRMEEMRRRIRYLLVFAGLLAAFCVIIVLNINTGTVHISVSEILNILFGQAKQDANYSIIWKIRLPRVLMAALLGGALSLSGFLLQTFFANPIAGPFVLGISSGAKMVVALTMIVFLKYFSRVSSYTLIIAAFIGSLIATGFILLMSRKINHMATLLVAGIMIGYICSAVTDFVVTFAEDSDIVNLHGWSQGSFSGMSWSNVKVAFVLIAVTVVITFLYSKPVGKRTGDVIAYDHLERDILALATELFPVIESGNVVGIYAVLFEILEDKSGDFVVHYTLLREHCRLDRMRRRRRWRRSCSCLCR